MNARLTKVSLTVLTTLCAVLVAAGVAHAATSAKLEPAAAQAKADALLAQARAVSGGKAWDALQSLAMTADAQSSAMGKFSYSTKVQLGAAPQEIARITIGKYQFAWGWDGQQAWDQDPTGAVTVLQQANAIAERRNAVFGDSYGYLMPSRVQFARQYLGQRTVVDTAGHSTVYDVVSVTPEGGAAIELLLNTQTHRVEGQIGTVGDPVQRQQFSDFRSVDGLQLPFVMESFEAATGKPLDRTRVQGYQLNIPVTAADFAKPAAQ